MRDFVAFLSMSTSSNDETILAKDAMISPLSRSEQDREREIQKHLSAPLIPNWFHLIIIVAALVSAFQTMNLGGILVGVPIWLIFDQILESRSKARMRTFYECIELRAAKKEK